MKNIEFQEITVNGKKFQCREVYHKNAEYDMLIGPKSLEDELVYENGAYRNEYAQAIDEHFYGFIDDNMLSELTQEELEQYVNENLD